MVLGTGIDGAGTVELLAEEHPGQLMREGKPRKADLPGSGRLYPRGKTKAAADDKAQAAAFLGGGGNELRQLRGGEHLSLDTQGKNEAGGFFEDAPD